jgi:hypothetical protein
MIYKIERQGTYPNNEDSEEGYFGQFREETQYNDIIKESESKNIIRRNRYIKKATLRKIEREQNQNKEKPK